VPSALPTYGTPPMAAGSTFFCPEHPDLRVSIEPMNDPYSGAASSRLAIYYPNGVRTRYVSEKGAQTGRYALTEFANKSNVTDPNVVNDGGYATFKKVSRSFMDPKSGGVYKTAYPDWRPTELLNYGPKPGMAFTSTLMARTRLEYRDQNIETNDCTS